MNGGMYVEEFPVSPTAGFPTARGMQYASFGGGYITSLKPERSAWNSSRRGESKPSKKKQKRALFAAAIIGFVTAFCAVLTGWVEPDSVLGTKGIRMPQYPNNALQDGTPSQPIYPHDPYQLQYQQQPPQQGYSPSPQQPPYLQQFSQQPSEQQPLHQLPQQHPPGPPPLQEPPQQPQLQPQYQPEPQQQHQQQQPPPPPPESQQQPLPPPPPPESQQQPLPPPPPTEPQQQPLPPPPPEPEPQKEQEPQLQQPTHPKQQLERQQEQQPQREQVEPQRQQRPEPPRKQPQQVAQPPTERPAEEYPQEGEEEGEWLEDEEDEWDGPIDEIPGPTTEEGVEAVIDDVTFHVTGLLVSLRSVTEETRREFLLQYVFVPNESEEMLSIFEYFTRVINGVRAVAPRSRANPDRWISHKMRVAFLIALLKVASERLTGIDGRLRTMPTFWEYSPSLTKDSDDRVTFLQGWKEDRGSRESLNSIKSWSRSSIDSRDTLSSEERRGSRETLWSSTRGSMESLASVGVDPQGEDEAEFSFFLKRLNNNIGGLEEKIEDAEREENKKKKKKKKEKKKKKHRYVTKHEAELLADFLGAARSRLEEDKEVPCELKLSFMREAGRGAELGSSGNLERRIDGQSRYDMTGAAGYAWHLARRAQTEGNSVLAEATQFFIELAAELNNMRQCKYHHPFFVDKVKEKWDGDEVENAFNIITNAEKERRVKTQAIKLSALRATQDLLPQSVSRRAYVDVLLLQAAIALL
ncbi:hypothetical protein, conserved [Eimeria brunetti]|uniref:Uncharacterized protein n=1 Tax=Eimeria brunetti TaxID=51314 RepID=U6LC14_9EIME|nr:hypothetical protein, conserved [Eimeria brunetti]